MSDKNTDRTASLAGQVALITGASQGLGAAIAKRLAEEDMRLVLVARNAQRLEVVARDIQTAHPTVQVARLPADVTDAQACQRVVDETQARWGRIDVLINNAGVAGKIALLQEIAVEEIDRVIDTNLKAPLYLMRAVLPGMIARQQGTILNINSVAGKTAYPYWSVYCASKFGLHAVTQAVGEEQRANHIKVAGLYPGAVDTPIWDDIEIDSQTARQGMLSAQQVAEAVAFMLRQAPQAFLPELVLKPLENVL
jgi:short-subunit dehydrogenase